MNKEERIDLISPDQFGGMGAVDLISAIAAYGQEAMDNLLRIERQGGVRDGRPALQYL
jgi:hypothetical protein